MRELTPDEQHIRDERRIQLRPILEEIAPVLGDFAELLELPNPFEIVAHPRRYPPSIDLFMRDQVVNSDDRTWILVRIAYFIGEVLIERFGGCWFLNEWPDTRYFLCYVVGQFSKPARKNVMVDVFEAASLFVAQPPGRSLTAVIDEIIKNCEEEHQK